MKQVFGLAALTDIMLIGGMMTIPLSAHAESPLTVVYPPPDHQTTAEQIFFIGTAPSQEQVFINNQPIKKRSHAGHFAPSLPLKMGENIFTIRHQDEEIKIKVTRNSEQPEVPKTLAFAPDSLTPGVDITRMPHEPICLGAVAPPNANVSAMVGRSKILLLPQLESIDLPPNSAVLTAENRPSINSNSGKYQGCTTLEISRNYGKPVFELERDGKKVTKQGRGQIEILSPKDIQVVEVIADAGVARTGASTNHSRLTPLPKGTRARVTGKEGEWLRLDYGGWLKAEETKSVLGNIPPQSIIRGITARQVESATEIIFPLQLPVPVEVKQKETSITLTLHNTTAQTDTIRLDANPIIKRLDWQQVSPTQIDYTFELHQQQQWGYDLRYEGTSLIFTLRHPPQALLPSDINTAKYQGSNLAESKVTQLQSLNNIEILLDPGHGGQESGAKGPTGYPEKDVNLLLSKLIEQELNQLGAKVYLTREEDVDVSLKKRVAMIDKIKPDLAISIHYNALPDSGDAENTQGISTFWYNTQAHDPAMFLHNYLVTQLNRPSYGTFWNNLALTRPHTAPTFLLELGFMINPEEFEWITNTQEQQKLAKAIAQGIKEWFVTVE
ncbi:N-acetylmuramoyl-L-alanine amidase [Pleurocapsa sp. PCC 7319]|uniref:N-acetylmuramoyl-L-alanine amidase n=1 Tax=Pleurocapsa sp. PCC 7319 TaxID=118161 RepID=UPI00034B91AA|nr:N-acetylmuramoyl-L-alanine amidase [Pleurocapsa sp. PCC 7319]